MTTPRPVPAYTRWRARLAAPPPKRLLMHDGHEAGRIAAGTRARFALALPAYSIAEAACDGACWAAPAVTLVRPGHRHRFARVDAGTLDALSACASDACNERGAGSGAAGLTTRLGRSDGSLGDAAHAGAFLALASALARPAEEVLLAAWQSGMATRHAIDLDALGMRGTIAIDVSGDDRISQHLRAGDPFRVIEGGLIAAHATGRGTVRFVGAHALDFAEPITALGNAALLEALGTLDGGDIAITIDATAPASGVATGETLTLEAAAAFTTILDAPPAPTRLIALTGAVPRHGIIEVPVDGTLPWSGLLALVGANPQRVEVLLVEEAGGISRRVERDRFEDRITPAAIGTGAITAN